MQDFTKLKVWQKAHALTLDVYTVTGEFPREEIYGLTSQIRRSCASIPANIAEGCGRNGGPELARFLQIAMGSASELQYYFLLCKDLGLLKPRDSERLALETSEIKQMLAKFIRRVRGNPESVFEH